MEIAAILALVMKGITVAEALIAAGKTAAPAFEAVKNLVAKHEAGTVTQKDLDQTESILDSLIADFNEELPED